MGFSVRSRGREAPGPGVRRTRLDEALVPGVSYLRSRGTTASPSDGLKVGGLGMTSEPKKEVLHQRSSQRAPEGQRCYAATVSNKGLCLNGGCISIFLRTPVETAMTSASDLADAFVRQSDKQSAETMCAISSVCPEQA